MKNGKARNTHDDFATPKELYDRLDAEFHFDFDPCPLHSPFDGLSPSCPWGQTNFINPPYTRTLKEAFIRRAYSESQNGKVCVMLLPVSTSTRIFHDIIYPNAEIRFLRGRPKFIFEKEGKTISNKSGQHDSMIVIFRPISASPINSYVHAPHEQL